MPEYIKAAADWKTEKQIGSLNEKFEKEHTLWKKVVSNSAFYY